MQESTSVRKSALTKWKNGYSIKTERYRLTSWGENGELGYELYDHVFDPGELFNLSADSSYLNVFDSLNIILNARIFQANIKPPNLGRQFEGVTPIPTPSVVTYRDIHDIDGVVNYYE